MQQDKDYLKLAIATTWWSNILNCYGHNWRFYYGFQFNH